ncbi:MAG: assimilatory sulfite reductase (NADPH) flavoprotein subunit [Betaproteobacteria bacterium]|nr:assimilatory sulfite reductase (NADPH) flavoprotein subunit [Betaproteobacteria bacterium]
MGALDIPEFPLTSEQSDQLRTLTTSLSAEQALWLSGYFAGLSASTRAIAQAAAEVSPKARVAAAAGLEAPIRTLTILYGSETANCATLGRKLAEAARAAGLAPEVVDMAQYKSRRLKEAQDVLIITSTHGEGDPPQPAAEFFEFVEGRKAPRLPDLRYAVLALGDATYERFCEAGKRLDRRLEELGATRLQPRIDCDVDYDDAAADWTEKVLALLTTEKHEAGNTPLAPARPVPAVSLVRAKPAAAVDKNNPAVAAVTENLVLTGRGSSKETRHVELSLGDSRLDYRPGDALGFVPQNDRAAVESILETLAFPAATPVSLKKGDAPLEAALGRDLEITIATPRFLQHWVELSGAAALKRLTEDAHAEERAAFLGTHHIVDILRRFPVPGIQAQQFVAGLRPLQPRLYSIASSSAALPGEAHLTVATVRYELHGQTRMGVASGYLATRGVPDARIPVYVQSNPLFRLPEDDRPILMIGAGTGVAPYRAFLQEREAHGANGKTWLFFGERHFRTDFLYQTEWQEFLKSGVLTRMNVAFSRDCAQKAYVQHRMLEHARDIYAWLEEGANVYVCGDAARLAPDVHRALVQIVARQGGLEAESAEEYVRTLQRDRRYQRDVY